MISYGERLGKNLLIGCAFTLVMTSLSLAIPIGAGGDQLTGGLLILAGYLILGVILGVTGVNIRKKKSDDKFEVLSGVSRILGLSFVIIGALGMAGVYIGANFGDAGTVIFALNLVIGILLAISSFGLKNNDPDKIKTTMAALFVIMAAELALSVYGFSGVVTGTPLSGASFNTIMISLIFLIFCMKKSNTTEE